MAPAMAAVTMVPVPFDYSVGSVGEAQLLNWAAASTSSTNVAFAQASAFVSSFYNAMVVYKSKE